MVKEALLKSPLSSNLALVELGPVALGLLAM